MPWRAAFSTAALAGGTDYNKVWQHHAFQGRVISMTDINSIPPKNFKFFYQSKKVPGWDENNRLEYQKGYVEISYKNKTWLADVPYDIYGDTQIGFYSICRISTYPFWYSSRLFSSQPGTFFD